MWILLNADIFMKKIKHCLDYIMYTYTFKVKTKLWLQQTKLNLIATHNSTAVAFDAERTIALFIVINLKVSGFLKQSRDDNTIIKKGCSRIPGTRWSSHSELPLKITNRYSPAALKSVAGLVWVTERKRKRESTVQKINWFIMSRCVSFSLSHESGDDPRRSCSRGAITIDNTRHAIVAVDEDRWRNIASINSTSTNDTFIISRRRDARVRLRIHALGDYVKARRRIATPSRRAEVVSRCKVFSIRLEFSCVPVFQPTSSRMSFIFRCPCFPSPSRFPFRASEFFASGGYLIARAIQTEFEGVNGNTTVPGLSSIRAQTSKKTICVLNEWD